ncbi:MAG: squalene synthase HpnC [Luteitalea sp.]|nr:squalene synthase HpnC [Luteitalea sp.]
MVDVPAAFVQDYRFCQALAQAHYENFPVASRLLPRAMRPHVAAIYAFARVADDLADEGLMDPAERLARLDEWRHALKASVARTTIQAGAFTPVFRALGHSIRRCRLDVALLDDLLRAFEQDVTMHRYDRWVDVLDYCRRSANPVGRLVLQVAGYRDLELARASDAVCTALQLANFWQDFGKDWRAGRLYVPREDAERWGAREEDLANGHVTDAWRAVLAELIGRTRVLLRDGRRVGDLTHGRLRLELRLTWLGGWTILDRLARAPRRSLDDRPTLSRRDILPLMWRAMVWR